MISPFLGWHAITVAEVCEFNVHKIQWIKSQTCCECHRKILWSVGQATARADEDSINKQSTEGFWVWVKLHAHVWQTRDVCLNWWVVFFPGLTWNITQRDRTQAVFIICLHFSNKHGIVQIWPKTGTVISCGILKEVKQDVDVCWISCVNGEECSWFFFVLLLNPRQGNLDLMQLSQFKSTFGKARAWKI